MGFVIILSTTIVILISLYYVNSLFYQGLETPNSNLEKQLPLLIICCKLCEILVVFMTSNFILNSFYFQAIIQQFGNLVKLCENIEREYFEKLNSSDSDMGAFVQLA